MRFSTPSMENRTTAFTLNPETAENKANLSPSYSPCFSRTRQRRTAHVVPAGFSFFSPSPTSSRSKAHYCRASSVSLSRVAHNNIFINNTRADVYGPVLRPARINHLALAKDAAARRKNRFPASAADGNVSRTTTVYG